VRALDLDDDVAEDLLDAAVERTWPV